MSTNRGSPWGHMGVCVGVRTLAVDSSWGVFSGLGVIAGGGKASSLAPSEAQGLKGKWYKRRREW